MNKLHRWLRKYLNLQSAKKIKSTIEFKNSLDLGCGNSENILNSFRADFPDYDAHNLYQFKDKEFDLIIFANVLEHLHSPEKALKELRRVGKKMYLCWTPWYSPYGGHEFSPKHFFGINKGPIHQLGINIFKTNVDDVVELIKKSGWKIEIIRPRYWPWMRFFVKLPWRLKDFLSWNVEIVAS